MYLSVDYLSAHKTKLQIGYVSLAVLAFILATTRLALTSTTVSRGSTFPIVVVCPNNLLQNLLPNQNLYWPLIQSLKSMIIMSYELLTEQSLRFQRWRSLKAIAILNVSEPVFWTTACILAILSTSGARGATAAISVILLIVSLVVM